MAISTTSGKRGTLATTNQPAIGTDSTIPLEARRKYSLSDRFIFKDFSDARLLSILSKRMQRKPVDDSRFKMFEDTYPRMDGTLEGGSAAGADAALAVGTTYMKIPSAREFLQAGSQIHIPKEQTLQTNTSMKPTGEQVEIVSVSEAAAAADDWCQVRRNIGESATTFNATAASGNSINFYTMPNANAEGGAAPDAFANAMSEVYNLIQIGKKTVNLTGSRLATKMWGPQNQQQWERQKKRKELLREVERAVLFGKRDSRTEGGQAKRYTGGIFYWLTNGTGDFTSWSTANDLVRGNGTSRLYRVTNSSDPTQWSPMLFFKYVQGAMTYGNRQAKLMFVGDGFAYEFNALFEGKVRLENDPQFFGMSVMKYHTPNGTINMIIHPELTHSGYTNYGITVDLDYTGYRFLSANGKNRDLRLQKSIQNNDVDGEKDQWILDFAIDLSFWESHSAIAIV